MNDGGVKESEKEEVRREGWVGLVRKTGEGPIPSPAKKVGERSPGGGERPRTRGECVCTAAGLGAGLE